MHICCSCSFFRFVLGQKSPNYRVYTKPRELTNQVAKKQGHHQGSIMNLISPKEMGHGNPGLM
jgi:hypothetical protein